MQNPLDNPMYVIAGDKIYKNGVHYGNVTHQDKETGLVSFYLV